MPISERDEFINEFVERWTESHKKSMIAFLALVRLSAMPAWSGELGEWLCESAGWPVTERGLHRLLQRLCDQGLLESKPQQSPLAGPDRKVYSTTVMGKEALNKMRLCGFKYLNDETVSTFLNS